MENLKFFFLNSKQKKEDLIDSYSFFFFDNIQNFPGERKKNFSYKILAKYIRNTYKLSFNHPLFIYINEIVHKIYNYHRSNSNE